MTAGSGVVLEADYWEMDANSTLYGVGCGYPAGLGPGAGVSPAFDLFPGGGGTHAGYGSHNYGAEKAPHGSYKFPLNLGSGGGSTLTRRGGAGGSAIRIKAKICNSTGIINMSGNVFAGVNGGGGAGGSILVECDYVVNVGSWYIDGGAYGSKGRAALHYNSSTLSSLVLSKVVQTQGVGGAGCGTFFIDSPASKDVYVIGNPNVRNYQKVSDYYAATIDNAGEIINITSIHAPGSASKLSLVNPSDTLLLSSKGVYQGSGAVYVYGTLNVPIASILSATSLSFAVEVGGVANLPPTLELTNSSFFCFGRMVGVQNITLTSDTTSLVLSGIDPGNYTFNLVQLRSHATLQILGSVLVNAQTVEVIDSIISATGTGHTVGTGPGAGKPSSSDGPSGGGGGHGGRGVTWQTPAKFAMLPTTLPEPIFSYYVGSTQSEHGSAYGDFKAPTTRGSGGGIRGYDQNQIYNPYALPEVAMGGHGGGAIHIIALLLNISGSSKIEADGVGIQDPNGQNKSLCGGGAGGSIFLEASNIIISSTSTISANGAYLGAGGRISIDTGGSASGLISKARSGLQITAYGQDLGSPGTIYVHDAAGSLLIVAGNPVITESPFAFGTPEYTAVVYNSTSSPNYMVYISNFGALTFLPVLAFMPDVISHIVQDSSSLMFMSGTIDLRNYNASNPLANSFYFFAPCYVLIGPNFSLFKATLFLDCTINSGAPSDISISQAKLQLGPFGKTEITGYGDLGAYYTFADISMLYAELELRPNNAVVPQLNVTTLNIDSTSHLHADFMGYKSMSGPLPGLSLETSGGHAGRGVNTDLYDLSGNETPLGYGDMTFPVVSGSGGGPYFDQAKNNVFPGGSGGGVVRVIFGTLVHEGLISADGQAPALASAGGAGGSIFLSCFGPCSIQDSNGRYYARGGPGASGGRIAIAAAAQGATDVSGGAYKSSRGAFGTVILNRRILSLNATSAPSQRLTFLISTDVSSTGQYVIDSFVLYGQITVGIPRSNILDVTTTLLTTDGQASIYVYGKLRLNDLQPFLLYSIFYGGVLNATDSAITTRANQVLIVNGTIVGARSITCSTSSFIFLSAYGKTEYLPEGNYNFSQISISGRLSLPANVYSGRGVTINADTFQIDPVGVVTADSMGYPATKGPSPASAISLSGHASSGEHTLAVGNFMEPTLPGSGGTASSGGGAIHIIANTMMIDGRISATGGPGAAAGSIWLQAAQFTGAGTVDVCGSDTVGVRTNGRLAIYSPSTPKLTYCSGTTYFDSGFQKTLTFHTSDGDRSNILVLPSRAEISQIVFPNFPNTLFNFIDLTIESTSSTGAGDLVNLGSITAISLTVPQFTNFGAIKADSVLVPSLHTAYNYGVMWGTTLWVLGTLKLMSNNYVINISELIVSNSADRMAGVVAFDQVFVSGQVTFVAASGQPPFTRPILSAHYLELQSTGNITADGEGFETDQTTGCFGGSSIHHGGGASASVPQEYPDDVVNPTVYGGAGFCDQVSKRSEVEVQEGEAGKQHNRWKQISRGGGAVHVVATYLKTNSRVSADGIIGGGGGSVWVDSGYLVASANASFTASGSGATSQCGAGGKVALKSFSPPNLNISVDASFCDPDLVLQPAAGEATSIPLQLLAVNQAVISKHNSSFTFLLERINEVDSTQQVVRTQRVPNYFMSSEDGSTLNTPSIPYANFSLQSSKTVDGATVTISLHTWQFVNADSHLELSVLGLTAVDFNAPTRPNKYNGITLYQNGQASVEWDTVNVVVKYITMNGSPIPININTDESKGDLAAYIVIPRLSGSGAVITFSTWNLYGAPTIAPTFPPTQPPTPPPNRQLPCIVWGESHFLSFAKNIFTLRGYGEYILARFGLDLNLTLEVQIRLAPSKANSTSAHAVALIIDKTIIQFYVIDQKLAIFVNSSAVAAPLSITPSIYLSSPAPTRVSLSLPSVVLEIKNYEGQINVEVLVDRMKNVTMLGGLCDLASPDSTLLASVAEGVRVGLSSSLFNYNITSSSYAQQNRPFVPSYSHPISDPTLSSQASQYCGQLLSGPLYLSCYPFINSSYLFDLCMADVGVSGRIINAEPTLIAYTDFCYHFNQSLVAPLVALHTVLQRPSSTLPQTTSHPTWLSLMPRDALYNTPSPLLSPPFTILFSPSLPPSSISLVPSGQTFNYSVTFPLPATYNISILVNQFVPIPQSPIFIPVIIPACLVNNGGCDYRATCDGTTGNATCGPCPTGTAGTGDTGCIVLCGDGTCDPLVGETCVSCFADCNSTLCGKCGDSKCDANENCTSCYEDCGPCKTAQCHPYDCSGHGNCQNGQCQCQDQWSGPSCNIRAQPIDVTINTTSPVLTVASNAKIFFISIKSISEVNSRGELQRSISILEINFTLTDTATGNNTQHNYSATLVNSAILTVLIYQFEDPSTNVTFANTTTTFPQHSIKLSIIVSLWPFLSLSNTLRITMDSRLEQKAGQSAACVNQNEDDSGSLRWFMIIVDNVSLYGKFLDKAIIDDRIRTISYTLNQDKTVTAILPHFWESAYMDPQFNVLLGDSNTGSCGDKSKNPKKATNMRLVAILVPIIVGSIVLIALGVVLAPRLRTWWQVRKMERVSTKDGDHMSTSMDDIHIEKIEDMEITTASGHYSLKM